MGITSSSLSPNPTSKQQAELNSLLLQAVASSEPAISDSEIDEIVLDLLDRGADVNTKNSAGETPLILAAQHGYIRTLRTLINEGAFVNASKSNGQTVMTSSLSSPYPYLTPEEILTGTISNNYDTIPWHWIFEQFRDPEIAFSNSTAHFLLTTLPQPEKTRTQALLHDMLNLNLNRYEREMLSDKRKWRKDLAAMGLTEGQQIRAMEVHFQRDVGWDSLTYLAAILPEEAAEVLNQAKKNREEHFEKKFEYRPASYEISKQLLNEKQIKDLRDSACGAEEIHNDKIVRLPKFTRHILDWKGQEKEVIDYKEAGKAIARQHKLNSLLLRAAKNPDGKVCSLGTIHTLEDLLDQGADINTSDNNGSTALMHASYRGHKKTVQTLIEHGADLDVRNLDDKTALMLAAAELDQKTIRILFKNDNQNEIDLAIARKMEILQTLVEMGSDTTLAQPNTCFAAIQTLIETVAVDTYDKEIFNAYLSPKTLAFLAITLPQEELRNRAVTELKNDYREEILTLSNLKQELAAEGLTTNQQNKVIAFKLGIESSRNNSTYLAAILPEELKDEVIRKFNYENPGQPLNEEKIKALRCFAYGTEKKEGFTNEQEEIDYKRAGEVILELLRPHALDRLTIMLNGPLEKNEKYRNGEMSEEEKGKYFSTSNKVASNSYLTAKIRPYLHEKDSIFSDPKGVNIFESYMRNHLTKTAPDTKPKSPEADRLKEESKNKELS